MLRMNGLNGGRTALPEHAVKEIPTATAWHRAGCGHHPTFDFIADSGHLYIGNG
jgi:hypothetical protein